jgi:proteasome lid subunit RPN8/RPN11
MHSLILTEEQLQHMMRHADKYAPLEACGLLAGKHGRVEKVIEVHNRAQSPVRYLMDPVQQLEAFHWIDSHDLDLLGIFHSHPTGPDKPSPTDLAEAAYEVVHVILARMQGTWQARGFWVEKRDFEDAALHVE